MVSNPPKVSFIPKGPITREESFLDRRRPRSITGFLAIFAFVASVGSYAGFYFYQKTLLQEVEKKAESITSEQRLFVQSPEINRAKLFRVRAELARELLDQHIAVSPVFDFLSNNTLESIMYDSFTFKRDNNAWSLVLTGESPSYASLAYQTDVLKKKNKEGGFTSFSISDITLTKSGTVTFTLSVELAQNQLLYSKRVVDIQQSAPVKDLAEPAVVPPEVASPFSGAGVAPSEMLPTTELPTASSASTSTMTVTEAPVSFGTSTAASGWTVEPAAGTSTASKPKAVAPTPTPAAKSFWSWFKFW